VNASTVAAAPIAILRALKRTSFLSLGSEWNTTHIKTA
jgi:hypothetical protein